MCFDSGDPADAWREIRRKARKAHRCDECHGPIQAGETYTYYSWIFENEPGSFKECEKCRTVRAIVHAKELVAGCHESESWCPLGSLGEEIGDRADSTDGYGLLAYDDETDSYDVNPLVGHLFPGVARKAVPHG